MNNVKQKMSFIKYKDNIDEDNKFMFNVFNPKTDGLIFSSLILIIPLLILLIFRFAFGMGLEQTKESKTEVLNFAFITFQILLASVACFVLHRRDRKLFTRTNAFGIFAYIVIPFLLLITLGVFISGIFQIKPNSPEQSILLIVLQIIAEILVLTLVIIKVPEIKNRIIITFKQNWKRLFITVAVLGLFVVGVSIGLSQLASGNSSNQEGLLKPFESDKMSIKISYSILLFIFTVLIAPIVEEVVFRDSIFTGVGNKWIGVIVSSLFFAMMHVSQGDLQNIWLYLIPSIIFSLTFVYTEGNVTYTWLIHMMSNLVSFILILISQFGN